ncbi:MAG TPA: hypothetical protein VEY30_07010 [Myxococcaceae bacterium]|nr:hypothetical protein [Myxococcaceae bacterium]
MRNRRVLTVAASCAFAVGGPSCVGFNTFQTASTLGESNLQFAVEPSAWGAADDGADYVYPRLDFTARYGLNDRTDLGLRLGSTGVELQSKFLLTRPGEAGFIASVAPSIGGFFVGAGELDSASLYLSLPLLLGFGFGNGSQWVFGPKLIGWGVAGGDGADAAGALYAGASVGVALRLGERFRLMPEVGVVYPIVTLGNAGAAVDNAGIAGYVGYQVGLGFLFGG